MTHAIKSLACMTLLGGCVLLCHYALRWFDGGALHDPDGAVLGSLFSLLAAVTAGVFGCWWIVRRKM